MEEAVLSWFNKVYIPLVSSIKRKHILHNFPKRTLGDLYIWVVKYWDELKQKFGDDIPLDEVVTDFSKTHKIPIMKRIKNQIKRIVLRRAINIYNSENSEP